MSKKTKTPARRPEPVAQKPATAPAVDHIDRNLALAVAAVAFLLYANTLGHGYVLDDDLAISLHENVKRGLEGIGAIFTQPYRANCFGGCLYRPLTLSAFAFEWSIAPGSPFIGHFFNVIWYAACSAFVYLSVRRLLPAAGTYFALALGVLFAAHPVHTEVVANIKSRDEIMSLFFVVLSLWLYARRQGEMTLQNAWPAALAFLGALLSKEGAITAAVVFPLAGWTFFGQNAGKAVKNSLWVLAPILLFFLLRGAALSGLTEPATSLMDNPIVEAHNSSERLGTAFSVLLRYLGLLAAPFRLISDYTYNSMPLRSLAAPDALAGLVLYAGIAAFAVWQLRKRRVAGFAAAAFLAAISLYSQLPLVIGTLMGERLLFTPSLWVLLGLAALYPKAADGQAGKAFLGIAGALALVWGVMTFQRNGDWKSNFHLFQADVAKSPNSVRLNDGYAEELYKSTLRDSISAQEKQRRLTLSEQHSKASLAIKPGVAAYINLGNLRFQEKNYPAAMENYEKAMELVPSYEVGRKNLSNTALVWARQVGEKENNPEKARGILLRALKYDDKNAGLYQLLGVSYGIQGNYPEALKAFEKAYALLPTDAEIKNALRATYTNMGMKDKADAVK